ncbi:DedA family protein [Methylobacterium sp. DB0501]|jgi:membrane protein DedA with SNARE-associated domain|uniref:DedA family protein n=1 Tax=Methylobacterium sp. DB0501 TaxID=2709665 RepID=UPI001FEDC7E8|nr:DedA family protein [Methylobacterium sp. DB0501]
MLLDNVFPPIPSELVMPLAGFVSARGQTSFVGVVISGTAGSLAGALIWYGVGRRLGHERLLRFAARHGRWLTLSPAEVERASAWFVRHGGGAVFLGRMIPGVRSLISVPAGVAGMPLVPFLAYSTMGSAIWTGLLATAGYRLGADYRAVAGFIEPIGNGVLILALALYLYRVLTFNRRAGVQG